MRMIIGFRNALVIEPSVVRARSSGLTHVSLPAVRARVLRIVSAVAKRDGHYDFRIF